MALVDSHCHLDFTELQADLPGVMARADSAGVGLMLTIGTQLSRFPGVRAVAEQFDHVYCSVGVHPHEAENEPDTDVARLLAEAAHPKVIGIGETGLDYFYDNSPRDVQRQVFRVHVAAARESGLPIIIHSRDADEDMAAILSEEMQKGAFTGLMHCFSSGRKLAEKAVELGLYISISGIATFKNAEDLRAIVADVPMDRLLVETDSPFLAPVPKRGKTCEPSYVRYTAEKVAEIKGISIAELEDITTSNFFTLFTKADRAALKATADGSANKQ